MRVYIACLASYNAGILHGEWIDLDGLDADDLREKIADMLRRSPCPNVEVPCPECGGNPWAAGDGHGTTHHSTRDDAVRATLAALDRAQDEERLGSDFFIEKGLAKRAIASGADVAYVGRARFGVWLVGCETCGGTGTVPSAEEWAVHDYDDFPNLGEYPSIERLIEVAEAISKHGEAMRVWLDSTGSVEGFEDAYYGTAESWEDFVARLLEETGALAEVPEHLQYYFDYAAYARDLKIDGWWAEYGADGRMHFFSA